MANIDDERFRVFGDFRIEVVLQHAENRFEQSREAPRKMRGTSFSGRPALPQSVADGIG
ncbi:MAG: hypothetical protein QM739_19240 [Propionivibrio sp.]